MGRFKPSPFFRDLRRPCILFLCTGDICRSAMTVGYLRKLMDDAGVDHVELRTAGVMTIAGLLPTQEAKQLLQKEGIDVPRHRSCQLTPEHIKRASLILGMTSFHVQMALRMDESARGKTYLFKEYTGTEPKVSQIQDPMGCTLEVYKRVFREIRKACEKLMKAEIMQPPRKAPLAISKEAAKTAAKATAEKAPAHKAAATAKARAQKKAPAASSAKPSARKAAKAAPPARKAKPAGKSKPSVKPARKPAAKPAAKSKPAAPKAKKNRK